MSLNRRLFTANFFRNTARYVLLTLGIPVFIFALLSGSGGISGIIQNSPNAIPWLLLLVLVFIAWRWELIGGVIITLLGLIMVYFFNFRSPNFFLVTFILTLLITLFGSFFLLSWYLRKNIVENTDQESAQ